MYLNENHNFLSWKKLVLKSKVQENCLNLKECMRTEYSISKTKGVKTKSARKTSVIVAVLMMFDLI